MLKLYDYFRSSASFRVRLALNHKRINYEKVTVNLLEYEQHSEEYLEVNPIGLVPGLVNNHGDVITQSLAIIEYLDETYTNYPLLPDDALSRAYVRSIALSIVADIHPLNNFRVLNYLKNDLGHSQEEVNAWYRHWIELGLSALARIIESSHFYTGKYCFEDKFTVADVCLLPQLFNARRFNCDLGKYMVLLKIEELCQSLDYVNVAYPDH